MPLKTKPLKTEHLETRPLKTKMAKCATTPSKHALSHNIIPVNIIFEKRTRSIFHNSSLSQKVYGKAYVTRKQRHWK